MITVSEKFINYFRNRSRDINIKIEISNGENWLEFDRTKIIDFEIDSSITEGQDFGLGNVIATKLILGLLTDNEIEKNAVVKPYIQLDGEDGATEWVQLGKYRIDDRKKQGNIWRFDCFDELIKAQQLYKSNLLYPVTSRQVLAEITIHLGYEMDGIDTLPEFQITRKLEDYLYTYREVLGYLGIIYSSNVIMDNTGKLKLIGVSDRSVKSTIEPFEHSGLNQINEPKIITKVVANLSGDSQISIGDGDIDNTLFIQNPLITEDIMLSIYNNVLDFTYLPLEIRYWRGFPYLECGDFVEFRDRKGNLYKTVIQSSKLVFKGGLSGNISSPSKSFSQSEYGFDGNTNQIIGSIQNRIGVYVLRENTADMTIDTRFQGKLMLPITSLGTTDMEFTITLIGEAAMDTILYAEIRSGLGVIGKATKSRIWEGFNTISINFLVRAVQQLSDNLLLFLRVGQGKFTVSREQGQFYVYGANLVGDSGLPYAAVEDIIPYEEYISSDSATLAISSPIDFHLSDTIGFEEYITSDDVQILIE